MRPVTLAIEGLRSFRGGQQPIDFTGRDHIAIIGDTGAGKSSILEAITFALYGRTTFSAQGNQELVNTTSPALRVVLTFDMRGDRWEATRVLRRRKDGTVGGATAELRRLGPDGDVLESYAAVREVNEKVEAILGLDADAFLRTVVLPQGQFARLLLDDDQRLRTGVLRQIWRTDELEEAGRLAADAVRDVGELVGRAQGVLEGEPADPVAHLAALEAAQAVAAGRAADAGARRAAVEEAVAAVVVERERRTLATKVGEVLGGWSAEAALATAAAVEEAAAAVEAEREDVDAAVVAARAELAAVPADDDGLDAAAVATAEAVLERLPALAAAAVAAEEALGTARQREVEAGGALAEATAAQAAADEARVEGERRRPVLERAVAAAVAVADAVAVVAAAEADHADAVARSAEVARAAGPAAAALAAAQADLEAAEAAVAEARRREAAAAAAHDLHEGDDCPVCARALPPRWSPPKAAALDRAVAAATKASAAVEAARSAAAKAEADAAAAKAAAEATDAALAAARSTFAATEADAAAPLAAAGVAAGADRAGAAAALLAAHDAEAEAAQELRLGLVAAVASARSGAEGAAAEVTAATTRAAEAATAVTIERDRLPGEVAAAGADGPALLAARRAVLAERAATRLRLRDALDGLTARRTGLDTRRRVEVDEPAAALWSTVGEHARQVGRAEDKLGLAPTDLPAAPPPSALAAAVTAVAEATAAVLDRAAAVATDAAAGLAAAEAVLDGAEPDPALAAARLADDEARLALRRAEEDAAAFRPRAPNLAALRDALGRLADARLAVDDLAAALKDGAFPKWLTLRRSKRLLVHASRLLESMTLGRYGFADLLDEGAPWQIYDHESGQPRSPASLSGGEKFVASLALALGMVEMVGRAGGVVESLFLDEGFGALDRSNLDAAVEALAAVADSGRMVAVISHLRAVAEQVDHVLSVVRTPAGSRATWLDPAERRALVDGEITTDGAVAGLLD